MDRLTSNSDDLKLAAVSDSKVWNVDLMNVSRKMVSWLRYLFTSFVVNMGFRLSARALIPWTKLLDSVSPLNLPCPNVASFFRLAVSCMHRWFGASLGLFPLPLPYSYPSQIVTELGL